MLNYLISHKLEICHHILFPGDASDIEPACQYLKHETQVWSLGQEDPLEEEMATHSSILAWGILMDRGAWRALLYSIGSQRIRHNWSDLAHIHMVENFGIFGSCFQSLLGGTRVAFNLALITSQPWDKTLLSILYLMLHGLCGVSTWQVGLVTVPGPVSDKNISLQTGKVLLSLASVSSHKWDDSSSAEYSIGFSGVSPLCSSLCSDLFCKLQLHWFSLPLSSGFLTSEHPLGYFWVPSPCTMAWKCSQGSECGNWRDYCVSSSSVLLCLMSTVLKSFVSYVLSMFLFDSGVNLVSATPLLGREMVCWNL